MKQVKTVEKYCGSTMVPKSSNNIQTNETFSINKDIHQQPHSGFVDINL